MKGPPKKIQLKFKTLAIAQENALASFGFSRRCHKINDWVIFEKTLGKNLPPAEKLKVPTNYDASSLPQEVQDSLTRRLNRIVDAYIDPYGQVPAIRAQAMMVANSVPGAQRLFVLNYIESVIDTEFFSPPWEDDNHQPNLGFC